MTGIAQYVGRRLVAAVLVLLTVSFAVFALLTLSPGSPEQILLGDRRASPEALAAIREQHHLDDPFLVQYGRWLVDAVQLNFGTSVRSSVPVLNEIGERFPITAQLALYATLILVVIAVPAGMIAGARRNSGIDRVVTLGGVVGVSAPVFVTGIVLLYVFGVALGWFPLYGAGDGLAERVSHLTLPAVALASTQVAFVARQTRAAALTVFEQDYTTFARARGLPRRTIWLGYALRNSALPVVTSVGLVVASSLTGAILVETTFSLPGLGALMIEAVNGKDIPVVQALSLLAAVVFVGVNLVADGVCLALDPRLRRRMLR